MKIIYSDNIPTDMSSERLWLDEVPKDLGERICQKLNAGLGDRQGPYYRVVEDHHKLYVWKP